MKDINYKLKQLIGSFILPKEALKTCIYPEYILCLQKERKIGQKQKLSFCENPCDTKPFWHLPMAVIMSYWAVINESS